MDDALPTADEAEYRKILKTRNQNMVKLQRYRVARQIEQMQPTIHFMEEGRSNEQVLFADSTDDLRQIVESHRRRQTDDDDDDAVLGKRSALEEVGLW